MKKTLTRMAMLGGLCVVLSLKPSIADAAEPCTISAPATSCPYTSHSYRHSPCFSECPSFDQAYLQRLMLRDALETLANSEDSPSPDEPAVEAVEDEAAVEEVVAEEFAVEEVAVDEVAVDEVVAEVAVEEELTEEEITAAEVADEQEALAEEAVDEEMLVEVVMDEELAWEDEEIQAPADIDLDALLDRRVAEFDPQWDCFPFGRNFDGCLDMEPGLVEKLDIDSCLPVIANLDHSAGLDLALEINEANDGLGDAVVEELFAEELVAEELKAEDFEAVVLSEEATEEEVVIEIEEGIDPEDAIQAVLNARAEAEASGDADELELYELIDLIDACDQLDADLKKVESGLKTLEAPAEIPAFEQDSLDLDGALEVDALELEEEALPQVSARPLMEKLATPAIHVLNLSVENLQTTMGVVAGALQQAFTR